MGTAPHSKLVSQPSRPFNRQNKHKFLHKKKYTTLQQLILLQDWQRVLIRVRLFPQELSQWMNLSLVRNDDEDDLLHLKVLPLHLVCALDPPVTVVQLLLELNADSAAVPVQPASMPSFRLSGGRTKRHARLLLKRRFFWRRNKSEEEQLNLTEDISVYFSAVNVMNSTHDGNEAASDDSSSISSSKSWNETKSVILQLSPSGGLTPLPLHSNETDSTLYSDSTHYCVHWDLQPLRHLVKTRGSLLPLHVACLYRASAPVLQIVLEAFPIGALSDVLGMLPIHWVAAGWSLPPLLPPPRSTLLVPTPTTKMKGPREALEVLKQMIPETTKVQSGNHGMTPEQYVQECMEDSDYKEACLQVLTEGVDNVLDDEQCSLTTGCSLLFVDSSDDTSSVLLSPGSTSNVRPRTSACLTALIAHKDWQAVLEVVEDDPQVAGKWLYGVDDDKTMAVPIVWKRLPIHLACAYDAPVGLVQMLIQSFPAGVATVDAHTGYLPLHIACKAGASEADVIKLLLETFPDSTKVADIQGRLPLHVAVIAMAPYAVVETLVEGDASAVGVVDRNEKTPMDYALQTYGREHISTELLAIAQLFADNSKSEEEGES